MPVDSIVLALLSTQRGAGTGDRRMVNVLTEAIPDELKRETYFSALKRPGVTQHLQPAGASVVGRGVYGWGATGRLYSVGGDRIYANDSAIGATLAASTGRAWFTETPATSSAQLLIVSDGTDNYNITTGDSVTQIDENDTTAYPTPNLGPIGYLDQYLIQAQSNGKVWNFDLNDFTTVSAASFLTAAEKGDDLEATLVQKDRVIAFGKDSISFYYNRGNPTGSPFQRIEQNRIGFGLAAKETLAWFGDLAMFVSESTKSGRSVWMLQAGSLSEISNSVLNRFLNNEGTSISSASAWIGRVRGQLVYVLNLSSADRSFVYNISSSRWDGEWQDASGSGIFNIVSSASMDGALYLQHGTNGKIYTIPDTQYQDDGTTHTVTFQTEGRDYETSSLKTVRYVELIGDTQSSGTATLEYSDDDFTTFTTLGTFDLTSEVKRIYRGLVYKGKRAWRLTHAQNTDFRVKALRIVYEVGEH